MVMDVLIHHYHVLLMSEPYQAVWLLLEILLNVEA